MTLSGTFVIALLLLIAGISGLCLKIWLAGGLITLSGIVVAIQFYRLATLK
jgi:hypothetical protein